MKLQGQLVLSPFPPVGAAPRGTPFAALYGDFLPKQAKESSWSRVSPFPLPDIFVPVPPPTPDESRGCQPPSQPVPVRHSGQGCSQGPLQQADSWPESPQRLPRAARICLERRGLVPRVRGSKGSKDSCL